MKTLQITLMALIFIGGSYLWIWHHDYFGLAIGIVFGALSLLRIKYWKTQ
jgi:hypothetical protein